MNFPALFIACLLLCSAAYAQETGALLKIPLSPVAGGLGDSSVALAEEAMGLHYNPAGLAFLPGPEAALAHQSYMQDIRGNSAAFTLPAGKLVFGTAPAWFSMKKEPVYDSLGTDTGESFGYEGRILPVAAAVRFGSFAAGAAVKHYSEDIGGLADSTALTDAGLFWRGERFSAGAAAQNMGGRLYGYKVVSVRRAGLAYSGAGALATAEIRQEGEAPASLGFGAGVKLAQFLELRAGWRHKKDFGGLTFGLGLRNGGICFDYSLVSYGDLGAAHLAGLSLAFGPDESRSRSFWY